eukprot:3583641-Rhodomonas_salina.3
MLARYLPPQSRSRPTVENQTLEYRGQHSLQITEVPVGCLGSRLTCRRAGGFAVVRAAEVSTSVVVVWSESVCAKERGRE